MKHKAGLLSFLKASVMFLPNNFINNLPKNITLLHLNAFDIILQKYDNLRTVFYFLARRHCRNSPWQTFQAEPNNTGSFGGY